VLTFKKKLILSDDPLSSRYKVPTIQPLPISGIPNTYGPLVWSQRKELIPPQINGGFNSNTEPADPNGKVIATIDEETAKRLFIDFVSSQCCYGKNAAEECEITKIGVYSALYVSLLYIKLIVLKILIVCWNFSSTHSKLLLQNDQLCIHFVLIEERC
jgi:hypothetical protein